jgi:hypothetical protein
LKCFDGVKSLKERGNLRRGGAGRCETGFVIRPLHFNPCARRVKCKIPVSFNLIERAPHPFPAKRGEGRGGGLNFIFFARRAGTLLNSPHEQGGKAA